MLKRNFFIIIFGLFVALIVYFYTFQPEKPTFTHILINNTDIPVTLADTPSLRQQGLSDTSLLGINKGMLFIFDYPGIYPFWMKEMHYPLDIIWINDQFIIADISTGLTPDSYPLTYASRTPVLYALEVNAGFTSSHHINIGDTVSIQ